MDMLRPAILAALLAALGARALGAPPPPEVLRDASVALGYDAKGRCPELVQADTEDSGAALVVLVVGPSGVPSQPSIRSSSGSESLDAAALSCVMKLRFLPAVRAGEGSSMASWQEIAWKWGRGHSASAPAPDARPSPAAAGPAATATTAIATATAVVPPVSSGPPPGPGGAEVRVCADPTGKLTGDPVITRSSGDPALDEAAVRIATSGAPYYRPAGKNAVTGCAQLAIKFER